jgi:uncharacterized membrane protein YheB (UPF0754 family)
MPVSYILIPLISAFIGYVTNWIAIKMLFHPRNPIRILGITIQGIFPKRQQQFAEKLGKLVSSEFLSFKDIEEKISSPENLKHILPEIETHVDRFLQERLAQLFPMISMFIGEKTIQTMKNALLTELEAIFPVIIRKYVGGLQQQLDLEHIVVEKVKAFSTDQLEKLLYGIMSKEFRLVEVLGGVLGFLIGCLQVLIASLSA